MRILLNISGTMRGTVLPKRQKGGPRITFTCLTSWPSRKRGTRPCQNMKERTPTDAMLIVFFLSELRATRCGDLTNCSPEKRKRREKESSKGVAKAPIPLGTSRTDRTKYGDPTMVSANAGALRVHGPTLALRMILGGMRGLAQTILGPPGIRGEGRPLFVPRYRY